MAARDAEFFDSMMPGREGSVTFVRLCPGELFELGAAAPADVPPVVTLVSPTVGSTIGPTDPIVFDLTDDLSLVARIIIVQYPDGTWEGAWNGTSFSGRFSTSTVGSITGGSRVTLRRTPQWQQSPTIEVIAVDSGGHLAP